MSSKKSAKKSTTKAAQRRTIGALRAHLTRTQRKLRETLNQLNAANTRIDNTRKVAAQLLDQQ